MFAAAVSWIAHSWIAQTLASSAVAILTFIAIRSTAIGERFLNHHLERRITDLEHAHEEKIEALRSDLAHLQDRGRRANELEFDAASKVWHAYVDAYIKTKQAIVDLLSFPPLNKLAQEDVTTFLESTELSEEQRAKVVSASDKERTYARIMRFRKINAAGTAIQHGWLLVRTDSIFISSEMSKRFEEGFRLLSKAQIEQQMNFEHGRGVGHETSEMLISPQGDGQFANLETLVRTTLRRE
jgi:hypothetical protein